MAMHRIKERTRKTNITIFSIQRSSAATFPVAALDGITTVCLMASRCVMEQSSSPWFEILARTFVGRAVCC